MNEKTLGQIAFEAYKTAVGGQTYDGKGIPAWESVNRTVQRGWEAAARAAIDEDKQQQAEHELRSAKRKASNG